MNFVEMKCLFLIPHTHTKKERKINEEEAILGLLKYVGIQVQDVRWGSLLNFGGYSIMAVKSSQLLVLQNGICLLWVY